MRGLEATLRRRTESWLMIKDIRVAGIPGAIDSRADAGGCVTKKVILEVRLVDLIKISFNSLVSSKKQTWKRGASRPLSFPLLSS